MGAPGAPGIWVRGDQTIEVADINDSPIGYNRLDAYKVGWVSVAYEDIPVVEGTEGAIRLNSPRVANVIQDEYGVVPPRQSPGYGEDLRGFVVVVRTYDHQGRPTGWRYSTLEEVMLGQTPRMATATHHRQVQSYIRRPYRF